MHDVNGQRSVSAAAEGRRLDAAVRVCVGSIGWKPLLNDVIRPQEQRRRDREAERDHAAVAQLPDPSLWIAGSTGLLHPVAQGHVGKGDV